jgi:hypothetical protein
VVASATAHAQGAPRAEGDAPVEKTCTAEAEALDSALDQYSKDVEGATNRVAETEQDKMRPHASGVFKVVMKDKSFDIPSITMKMQRRDLELKKPEVTLAERRISFDVVEMRMELRTVMSVPEIVCSWRGCKTRRKPIKTKVPVFTTTRKTISLKVPQITMASTKLVISTPSMTVGSRRVSLKLPELTAECWQINNPEACAADERKEMESAARESQQRMEKALVQARANAARPALPIVDRFFRCERAAILEPHRDVAKVYDASIKQVMASLALLEKQGGEASDESKNLTSELKKLEAEAAAHSKLMDEKLAELDAYEAEVLKSFASSSPDGNAAAKN